MEHGFDDHKDKSLGHTYLYSSGSATPYSRHTDEAPDVLVLPVLGHVVQEVEGHDGAHTVGDQHHWSAIIL